MSNTPEIEKSLNDAKKTGGYVLAEVKWEHNQHPDTDVHRVEWKEHADPWREMLERNNVLDSQWSNPPKGEGEDAFKVGKRTVCKGKNGVQEIKWYVWEEYKKLARQEKELYAVMRVEHHYLKTQKKLGYRKITSKYFQTASYKGENSGIDSFFVLEGKKPDQYTPRYIICESKFNGDDTAFNKWKGSDDKARQNLAWNLLRKDKKKKGLVQMSWQWLRKRTVKVRLWPAGCRELVKTPWGGYFKLDKALAKSIADELYHVGKAATKKSATRKNHIRRYINHFGANRLPMYPGRYRLYSKARVRYTIGLLHLKWDLNVDFKKEFMFLTLWFEDRCEKWQKGGVK
jgi:hypothetical protein